VSLVALEANDPSKLGGLTRRGRHLRPDPARLFQEPNSGRGASRQQGHDHDASGESDEDPSPGSPEHPARRVDPGGHVGGPPPEHLADLVFDVKHR